MGGDEEHYKKKTKKKTFKLLRFSLARREQTSFLANFIRFIMLLKHPMSGCFCLHRF